MLFKAENTFWGRAFVYVLIFSFAIPCPQAFAPPFTVNDLPHAERAIYEMFLNPNPTYEISETPGTLANDPFVYLQHSAIHLSPNWTRNLTGESYRRLLLVAPHLKDLVEKGRANRRAAIEKIVSEGQEHLEKEGLTENAAEDVRLSYLGVLKFLRKRQKQKITELEAKLQAEEVTRRRNGIAGNLPPEEWPAEAKKQRTFLTELFKDELKDAATRPFLPARVFAKWKAEELAKIERYRERLIKEKRIFHPVRDGDTVMNFQLRPKGALGSYVGSSYLQAKLASELYHLDQAKAALTNFTDPEKGHGDFLTKAEQLQAFKSWMNSDGDFIARQKLGGPDRNDGELTKPRKHSEWLADLEYSGEPYNAIKHGIHDRKGTSIREILEPEKYQAEKAVERAARNKERLKVAATLGGPLLGVALLFGGGYYALNRFFPSYGAGVTNSIANESSASWNKTHGNGGLGAVVDLFGVTPLGKSLGQIPRELELAYLEDARGGVRDYEFQPGETAKPDFKINSERNATARQGLLTVPWVQGYDTEPAIWQDGVRLRAGTDYHVKRGDHNGLVIELAPHLDGDFQYEGKFFAGNSGNLPPTEVPVLTAREIEKLSEVAKKLSEARHTKLAEALSVIAEHGKQGKRVTAKDLQDAIGIVAHYGGKDARKLEGAHGDNQYLAYLEFADLQGDSFIECDTAAEMLKDIYKETLVDHPKLEIATRHLLVREDGETKVGSDRGHRWVSLVEPGHSPLAMDGTPSSGGADEVRSRAMAERVHGDGSGFKLPWWWPAVSIVPVLYALRKKWKPREKVAERTKRKPNPKPESHAGAPSQTGGPSKSEGPENKPAVALESEADRRAREARNEKRKAWIKELHELTSIVITNREIVDAPNLLPHELVPHRQAVQAATAIEKFVTQEKPMTEEQLIQELVRILVIPEANRPNPLTLQAVLAMAEASIRAQANRVEANAAKRRVESRFAAFIDPDLLRPSLALLNKLPEHDWSPLEPAPVAKPFGKFTCESVLSVAN